MKITRLATVLFLASALAANLVVSSSAQAAIYKCHPTQAFVWKDGKIQPQGKVLHPWRTWLIKYDDKENTMWIGLFPDGPFSPQKMRLLQPISTGNDLVAMSTSALGERFSGYNVFRIRNWNKKAGLIFLFSSDDELVSGKCDEPE